MVDKSLPYAQALLSIGQDTGAKDTFLEELVKTRTVLLENEQLIQVLRHPAISNVEKEKMLLEIFKGDFSEPYQDFLKVVCRHSMAGCLAEIADDYARLLDESRHIQTVKVISAAPLDEAQKEKLTAVLEKKLGGQVRLQCSIDEKLIAGMKIQTEDSVLDATYLGQLEKMKEQLVKS